MTARGIRSEPRSLITILIDEYDISRSSIMHEDGQTRKVLQRRREKERKSTVIIGGNKIQVATRKRF